MNISMISGFKGKMLGDLKDEILDGIQELKILDETRRLSSNEYR